MLYSVLGIAARPQTRATCTPNYRQLSRTNTGAQPSSIRKYSNTYSIIQHKRVLLPSQTIPRVKMYQFCLCRRCPIILGIGRFTVEPNSGAAHTLPASPLASLPLYPTALPDRFLKARVGSEKSRQLIYKPLALNTHFVWGALAQC